MFQIHTHISAADCFQIHTRFGAPEVPQIADWLIIDVSIDTRLGAAEVPQIADWLIDISIKFDRRLGAADWLFCLN